MSSILQIISEQHQSPPVKVTDLENNQIFMLSNSNSGPFSLNGVALNHRCPPHQQSLTLLPTPQYNMPLHSPNPPFTFPFICNSVLPPVTVPPPTLTSPVISVPSSQLTPLISPTEQASIYCPPLISSNPSRSAPLLQPQIQIEGFQPPLPMLDIGPQPNLQYINHPPVTTTHPLRLHPLPQLQVLSSENSLPLQCFPDYNYLSQNVQLPIKNYPLVPQFEPNRAPYIQSMSLLPEDIFSANLCPNVNPYLPYYQVASLPPVLPNLPHISESPSYLPNQFVDTFQTQETGDLRNSQLPINLQINIPPSPAPIVSVISPIPPYPNAIPISAPPFGMSPIIIGKSKSKWKDWLPAVILALFTNNIGGFGSVGSSNCCYYCYKPGSTPENVYIPYPIPISTNNPIICNKGSSGKVKKCDTCNKAVDAD